MTNEEFTELLSINGRLVAKRCTESYLKKHNLYDWVIENTPEDFVSISDKIKYIVYGGGYCLTCGVRTNEAASGRGFGSYCPLHFHDPKKNKHAHNRIEFDLDKSVDLYHNENKSMFEIAKIMGVSNVTLANRFKEYNVEIRPHAENQKIQSPKGYIRPRIIIDREVLVDKYINGKIPAKNLAAEYDCHEETIRRFLHQESVQLTNNKSYLEQMMMDLLDKHNIQYIFNGKKVIAPFQIDFYLDEYKLGIETNGIYTHSFITGNKDKYYHNTKFKMAQDQGVQLLQFWEPDIVSKLDIIENIILSKCGKIYNKLDARKCIINDVPFFVAKSFYNSNHIQGSPGSNCHNKGLFYNDQLVSIASYTIKNEVTVIHRFCSLKGYTVRGAFSKLCNIIPGKIIKTYSSNDISTGKLYEHNGFILIGETKADLHYTNNSHTKILNRQHYMKYKLAEKLEFFDANKTELENMFANKYDAIFKSGVKTWMLQR